MIQSLFASSFFICAGSFFLQAVSLPAMTRAHLQLQYTLQWWPMLEPLGLRALRLVAEAGLGLSNSAGLFLHSLWDLLVQDI